MTAAQPGTAPTVPGRLPVLGHMVELRRRPLDFLVRIRALGPVVKIGFGPKPAYVVNDPDLIRRVLVEDAHSFDKGVFWEKIRAILGNGLASSGGEFHIRQRRLMQPAFHRDRIARYAEIMSTYLTGRVSAWIPGQVLFVTEEMRDIALALVSKALFASQLGAEAMDAMLHHSLTAQSGAIRRTMAPLGLLEKLPTPANRRFDEAVDRIGTAVNATIASYAADGRDHGDLMSMLVSARDPDTGEAMTIEQVRDEVITLALAGTDTTANALSWLFHQLGQQPHVADRIADEVNTVVGDRRAGLADLAGLDYTNRVVQEIFRLYPFWLLMRRTLTDITLGGTVLPAGCQVLISPLAMHRDPAIYPDPLRLDPDRWLPDRAKDIPRNVFLPFGAGRRQCIGDRFAWTEIMLATAAIVPRWKLCPVPGRRVSEVVGVAVTPSSLQMHLVRRPATILDGHPDSHPGGA